MVYCAICKLVDKSYAQIAKMLSFVFCLGDSVWAYLEKKLFSQETK